MLMNYDCTMFTFTCDMCHAHSWLPYLQNCEESVYVAFLREMNTLILRLVVNKVDVGGSVALATKRAGTIYKWVLW